MFSWFGVSVQLIILEVVPFLTLAIGVDNIFLIIHEVEESSDQSEAAYQLTLAQAQHALTQPAVRGLHIADFRHDDTLARLMSDLGRTPH